MVCFIPKCFLQCEKRNFFNHVHFLRHKRKSCWCAGHFFFRIAGGERVNEKFCKVSKTSEPMTSTITSIKVCERGKIFLWSQDVIQGVMKYWHNPIRNGAVKIMSAQCQMKSPQQTYQQREFHILQGGSEALFYEVAWFAPNIKLPLTKYYPRCHGLSCQSNDYGILCNPNIPLRARKTSDTRCQKIPVRSCFKFTGVQCMQLITCKYQFSPLVM